MIGIGNSTAKQELAKIKPFEDNVSPIQKSEFEKRIEKACQLMIEQGVQAIYLHAGTNLLYFTGTQWSSSERMVGALLFQNGKLDYITPQFEKGTLLDFMIVEGSVHCWEEHESPYKLFIKLLKENNITSESVSMDETTPFFIIDGILRLSENFSFKNAKTITAACRMIKSNAEIVIIKRAMDITLEVQKATARILRVGISTKEVTDFINEAHKLYGITTGSYFCIVLFGTDTSFPHGVRSPKNLDKNDLVLIDTGCLLHNYISDITRTYVFGEADDLQISIWNIEKEAQQAAYNAAQIGNRCADIDRASRKVLEKYGLGPNYELPGLPHRTGHGIGLDIHEWPYLVKNDITILEPGMCFSNEPMICVPGKFGVRLEDHIYMTKDGPEWFTEPTHSIKNPFGV